MNDIIGQLIGYARGIWSNRWIAIAVTWAVCLSGWTVVYLMPNVFEAQARFYVDTGSRLREVVQDLGMEPNVASRVFLVRQAMMGRPQLEKVARETDLDLQVTSDEQMDGLLTNLRENINISTGRQKEAKNLFNISFRHEDRMVAQRVVTALLNSFYDDVLQQKDSDTERTQEFLTEQLTYYRQLLEQTETKLQNFKRDHAGFVVGDRGDYFARMQSEEEMLLQQTTQRSIEIAKRDELRRQLARVNPYAPVNDEALSALIPGNETSQHIAELERSRRDLLLRVTELHPDVTALNEQIAQLKIMLERELATAAKTSSVDGASSATNPVYIEIQIALSNANLKIAGIEGEIGQSQARLSRLKTEVDLAPELERQYLELTRDYANYRSLYDEVLNKSERERIGRVGDEKDVISFNTIEPPRAGIEPTSPNRPMLLIGVLIAGLIAGAGVGLVLWLLKPTIHSVEDLQRLVKIPTIGTLSLNLSQARQSHSQSLLVFGAAGMVLLVTFVFVLIGGDSGSTWLQDSLAGL